MKSFLKGFASARINRFIEEGAFRSKAIMASKHTGLGHRIAEILNAKRISEALQAQLLIHWPDNIHSRMHGIKPADAVFSGDFMERHVVCEIDLDHYHLVKKRDVNLSDMTQMLAPECKGLRINNSSCVQLSWRGAPFLRDYSTIFRSIGFSDELEKIRSHVDHELPAYETVLHVRRGDIYSGVSRIGGMYVDKVLPLPLIRLLLKPIDRTENILLIGNDLDLIEGLCKEYGVSSLNGRYYSGDRAKYKDDFFDICVLAKCHRVIGAASGFVQTAAMIGGAEFLFPTDILSDDEMFESLLEFVKSDDQMAQYPEEAAVVCQYLGVFFKKKLTEEIWGKIIEMAYQADPKNPEFVLKKSAMLLKKGNVQLATQVLQDAANKDVPQTMLTLLKMKQSEGVNVLRNLFVQKSSMFGSDDLAILETYSGISPWINFYTALYHYTVGDFDKAITRLEAYCNDKMIDRHYTSAREAILSETNPA